MQTNLHVCAYSGSVGAGLTNVDIAAVNDTILTRVNNHFIVPQKARLLWAFGTGTNMSRLRLNTPSLRLVGLPSLVPINTGTTVPSPYALVDFSARPTFIPPIDEIEIDASQTDAGAQTMRAILAFQFDRREPSRGPVYRLRATGAITAAADTWVNGSLTLDQSIPQGRYEVVGLDVVGTNLIAARLVFPGASFRPGVVCRNTVAGVPNAIFNGYDAGVLGWFDFPNLPTLDIFSTGANTSQEVFLDVIRVSDSLSYNMAV